MSSNTYTLKIDIDDSKIKELEKRLMAIMGGQMAGMSKMQDAAKGGSGNTMAKNIAKLGIIAIGVGSLVGLVSKISGMLVDSSPMLKQMLKLVNFSVMLILRPIGDFIGFFLKPVIIFMLRKFVIPFYKSMRNPAMQAGSQLGEAFVDAPIETMADVGFFGMGGKILASADEYAISLKAGASQVGLWFDDIFATPGKFDFTALDTWVANTFSIDKLPTVDWTGIKAFTAKFLAENLPTIDWSFIKTFLDKFSLENLPTINWTWLKEFLKKFGILQVPTFSWSGLIEGLDKIKTEVTNFINAIVNFFTDLISKIPGVGSDTDSSGNTTNYIDLNMNGVDDVTDLQNFDLLKTLGDIFAGNGNN